MAASSEFRGGGGEVRNLPLTVVGVSHRTASLEVRERLAFGESEIPDALRALREDGGVEEAVLLSTCNRTEVYLFPVMGDAPLDAVRSLLSRKAGTDPLPSLDRILFRRNGDEAVRHLFQVSSGMDSMVMGEAEIQGQVRDAYRRAASLSLDPPMAGPVLNRLFQMALSVGGRVRSETTIGEGRASVASVAVQLARKIFGHLKGKRVLVLGAGAMAEVILEALSREGLKGVIVANRTLERAEEVAERLGARAVAFSQLRGVLPHVDIVLAGTAAPHHVVTREIFREAFPEGPRHPLFIIDIAVPRDVDPALGEEPEVFLYNLDDLQRIVEETVRVREEALPEAQGIIEAHALEFHSWYASLEVIPVIRKMRSQAEEHRSAELDRLFRGLEHLPEEDRERIEEFSRRLLNKVLHDPLVQLRRGIARGGRADLVDAVRFLYGFEGDTSGKPIPHPSISQDSGSDTVPIPTPNRENGE